MTVKYSASSIIVQSPRSFLRCKSAVCRLAQRYDAVPRLIVPSELGRKSPPSGPTIISPSMVIVRSAAAASSSTVVRVVAPCVVVSILK